MHSRHIFLIDTHFLSSLQLLFPVDSSPLIYHAIVRLLSHFHNANNSDLTFCVSLFNSAVRPQSTKLVQPQLMTLTTTSLKQILSVLNESMNTFADGYMASPPPPLRDVGGFVGSMLKPHIQRYLTDLSWLPALNSNAFWIFCNYNLKAEDYLFGDNVTPFWVGINGSSELDLKHLCCKSSIPFSWVMQNLFQSKRPAFEYFIDIKLNDEIFIAEATNSSFASIVIERTTSKYPAHMNHDMSCLMRCNSLPLEAGCYAIGRTDSGLKIFLQYIINELLYICEFFGNEVEEVNVDDLAIPNILIPMSQWEIVLAIPDVSLIETDDPEYASVKTQLAIVLQNLKENHDLTASMTLPDLSQMDIGFMCFEQFLEQYENCLVEALYVFKNIVELDFSFLVFLSSLQRNCKNIEIEKIMNHWQSFFNIKKFQNIKEFDKTHFEWSFISPIIDDDRQSEEFLQSRQSQLAIPTLLWLHKELGLNITRGDFIKYITPHCKFLYIHFAIHDIDSQRFCDVLNQFIDSFDEVFINTIKIRCGVKKLGNELFSLSPPRSPSLWLARAMGAKTIRQHWALQKSNSKTDENSKTILRTASGTTMTKPLEHAKSQTNRYLERISSHEVALPHNLRPSKRKSTKPHKIEINEEAIKVSSGSTSSQSTSYYRCFTPTPESESRDPQPSLNRLDILCIQETPRKIFALGIDGSPDEESVIITETPKKFLRSKRKLQF